MLILLRFDYAEFDVSNLFFSKVIKEKPLGSRLEPSSLLGQGRVKFMCIIQVNFDLTLNLAFLSIFQD